MGEHRFRRWHRIDSGNSESNAENHDDPNENENKKRIIGDRHGVGNRVRRTNLDALAAFGAKLTEHGQGRAVRPNRVLGAREQAGTAAAAVRRDHGDHEPAQR